MISRIHTYLRPAISCVALVPLVLGQISMAQTGIVLRKITGALMVAGVSTDANQIDVLSGVTTNENAMLYVVRATSGPGGLLKVKLRCHDNHECLPFYVLVHGIDEQRLTSSSLGLTLPINAGAPQNLMRGGEHATLILETPNSRMSLPVISLQAGVLGQKIRVTSLDHRQFYDAKIVAVGLLEGNL